MAAGGAYFNCYYPGALGLPSNVVFEMALNGRLTILHLVRHLRPVVITDFGNDFLHRVDGPRRHLLLKRAIPLEDANQISVDVKTMSGAIETIAAYGKEHEYSLWRRQSATEITVGAEVASLDEIDVTPAILFEAIERMVTLYRTVTTDTRIQLPSRLTRDVPVIRQAVAPFRRGTEGLSSRERLIEHLPSRFQPIIFSFKEYESYLREFRHDQNEVGMRIGHHLAIGTELSEAKKTLTDSFELLVSGGSPRFALVEAVSVSEFLTFDVLESARHRDEALHKRMQALERKSRITLAKALGLLPALLTPHWPAFSNTLPGLFRSAERRNKALHERAPVHRDEALAALNHTQQLIFAVEVYERDVG